MSNFIGRIQYFDNMQSGRMGDERHRTLLLQLRILGFLGAAGREVVLAPAGVAAFVAVVVL